MILFGYRRSPELSRKITRALTLQVRGPCCGRRLGVIHELWTPARAHPPGGGMLERIKLDREPSPEVVPWRVSARLNAEQQRVLLEEYKRGVTGQELADRYGVARSAVIQFLRSQGVSIRRKRLSEADMALIVELYQAGERQVDIAARVGRDKRVIWHALRRAGLV